MRGLSWLVALASCGMLVLVGCQPDEVTVGPDAGPAPDSGMSTTDAGPGGTDGGSDAGPGGVDAGSGDAGSGDAGSGDGGGPPIGCGDRRIVAPEQCDDGNTMSGDGCSATCMIEVSMTCGDGVVDRASGEQCDDANTMNGDGCDDRCQIEPPMGCGDGTLDLAAGEECDDGNTNPGDGCSPACQLEAVGAFCGDGMMDPGEVCDDGNTANGDGCSPTCNNTTTVSIFVGMPGSPGNTDGRGMAATIGGGVITADATHLWLGDAPNRVLRRIEVATADVLTIAGSGTFGHLDAPGVAARLGGLEGITTNGIDTVYLAQSGPVPAIRAVSMTAPFPVTTLTGGPGSSCMSAGCYADGLPGTATFNGLRGLTWYGGFLWIVDPGAAVILRVDPTTGDVVTVAGTPFTRGSCTMMGCSFTDGVGGAATFISPRYIVSDGSGMLYVSDTQGASIRAFNTVTNEVTTFAGDGTFGYLDATGLAARIHRPRGITSDGSSLYWVEFNAHTLRQGILATQDVTTMVGMALTGGSVPTGGASVDGNTARLQNPFSVTYHFPTNSLFVVDNGNDVIKRVR